ncbi:MAG: hypothetical protein A2836_01830 [Candidatus Taylorbacteria bacterium RIFCSPHIGHO2_01_FULL_45_63]|uniref:RNHCP domain-containing protein n=1 Tax=Candidatus Taylorbacteria bacterium RIFCSPHIGHO2_02_FULL_45_35 TaxID=1802311 RepID=A0A1G2MT04_9BACT|nr:MAG: hypothetical protein A2836_01830 [Candidatus Taylorbacteria bacterium RIFCSPHIGHO2_01_FULL_45_63]OHA26359.1 MAG: hypothetical protein A3D56_03735 [Candidatus Taylorbacteria bacterium RIFCSPHIGHO2_02_FULL_45_35]OHA32803.1 MAG: hypothetical protein A3A22_02590 [Candidatus Taylorbacteria bacterium RIFCSPLOWO2_01_FULL_45_34b]
MNVKKFQKKKEDFVCEHCGAEVFGNGYTNHCPKCLWSKHVDINPGDRKNPCGGAMQPVSVFTREGKYMLVHRCLKCKEERTIRTIPEDNFEQIIALSQVTIK